MPQRKQKPRAPRPQRAPLARGELREFVRNHLHLRNTELANSAAEAGLPLTAKQISAHRHAINTQKGTRKRKYVKRTSTSTPPESVHPKAAALRKLIFTMGFDVARKVFDDLRRTMKG